MEGKIENHTNESHKNARQSGIPVRLGCGSIIILTMLCSVFVVAMVNLVITGEIDIRGDDLEGIRLWTIRGDGISTLGVSYSQEVEDQSETDDKCIETDVRFFIWEGKVEFAQGRFCECYDLVQGRLMYDGMCVKK